MKIRDMSDKDMGVLKSEWLSRLEPSNTSLAETLDPVKTEKVSLKPKPIRPNKN